MTSDCTNGKEQLTLRSRTSELARIPPWIEYLASRNAIPKKTQFAMNLCLEEALSNIIRHGYEGAPDRTIVVGYTIPESGRCRFVVDDEGPRFNPIEALDSGVPDTLDEAQAGGQGIRLLKYFADALEYEELPSGNRLSISFFTSRASEG